jgi:AAA15 family ATPase/GTPase
MLTELTIENFKGIQTCKIEDLGRINLFIGKNDSGKSTILEAMYYFFQELRAPPTLQQIMSRRADVSVSGRELWFKYRQESPISFSVTFSSLKLVLTVTFEKRTGYFTSVFTQESVSNGMGTGRRVLRGTTYRGTDFAMTNSYGAMTENLHADDNLKAALLDYSTGMELIDCTLKSKTTVIEDILSVLKITSEDEKFGEVLNDIYGKGKEWEFMPTLANDREKRLAIKEGNQLTYFSDFGDGLRCCVGILGTAISSVNTALFIEEIESHQHYGSLSKLLSHLVKIARENKLQVFLTTHSIDIWNSLSRGVYVDDQKREKEEFRCFLMERDMETGKVTIEQTDDYQKITKALGN